MREKGTETRGLPSWGREPEERFLYVSDTNKWPNEMDKVKWQEDSEGRGEEHERRGHILAVEWQTRGGQKTVRLCPEVPERGRGAALRSCFPMMAACSKCQLPTACCIWKLERMNLEDENRNRRNAGHSGVSDVRDAHTGLFVKQMNVWFTLHCFESKIMYSFWGLRGAFSHSYCSLCFTFVHQEIEHKT